jgi:acyl-CoA thioester hydrolase
MLAEAVTATPDLTTRGAYPHWRTDVIRFADLDPLGHVNNVAYLTYIESGRVMFSAIWVRRLLAPNSRG